MDDELTGVVRYRLVAAAFGAPAALLIAIGIRGLMHREVVTVAFALAPLYLAAAFGLWTRSGWGRTLGLVLSLTNLGLGTLGLVGALLGRGSLVGPGLFVIIHIALVLALARSSGRDSGRSDVFGG